MLSPAGGVGSKTAVEHVDIGSLFVPTRVHAAAARRTPSTAATSSPVAARIAGLQHQPTFQEDASTGLLLPPRQQLARPGEA